MKTALICKEDVGATLSTWIFCSQWQLYAVEKMGYMGYVYWPNHPQRCLQPHWDPNMFAQCPNMYEWWFEQPWYDGPQPPAADATFIWEHFSELGQHNLVVLPLPELKAWYRERLKFNPTVASRIQALVDKYAIDFDNTIGVAWRGCDSVDDGRPRMPIETYFPFIDDILEKEPNLRIFATAEETTVTDKIKARYSNVFTVDEFFSAPWGYKGHSEYVNPASGYERGVQTCQLISILSRCKHLVKNRSSMSGVAGFLSQGHIVNLAHPENLGHGFDITKAEINGQLVPLNRA